MTLVGSVEDRFTLDRQVLGLGMLADYGALNGMAVFGLPAVASELCAAFGYAVHIGAVLGPPATDVSLQQPNGLEKGGFDLPAGSDPVVVVVSCGGRRQCKPLHAPHLVYRDPHGLSFDWMCSSIERVCRHATRMLPALQSGWPAARAA